MDVFKRLVQFWRLNPGSYADFILELAIREYVDIKYGQVIDHGFHWEPKEDYIEVKFYDTGDFKRHYKIPLEEEGFI